MASAALPDAPSTALTSLILEAGRPEEDGGRHRSADREIAFYRHVAPRLPPRVVPRCFATEVATPTQPAWSLLEDLSETHTSASDHPLPPRPRPAAASSVDGPTCTLPAGATLGSKSCAASRSQSPGRTPCAGLPNSIRPSWIASDI